MEVENDQNALDNDHVRFIAECEAAAASKKRSGCPQNEPEVSMEEIKRIIRQAEASKACM